MCFLMVIRTLQHACIRLGSQASTNRVPLALRDSAATGPDADRDAAGHRSDWLRPIGSGLIAVNAGGTTLMLVLPAGTGNDVAVSNALQERHEPRGRER